MRNDKHLALALRQKGYSYLKISKELEVPKSTLSSWFSNLVWSNGLRKELAHKASYIARKRLISYNKKRREEWEAWREASREEARKDFPALSKNPLFIAGLMLYWGEGDSKMKNPIRLTNTDPRMIKLYIEFLTRVLQLPKENLRVTLILYQDLDEKQCKHFWSNAVEIPETQFYKTQLIKGKHPTKRLTNGICMVTCSSRQLKEKFFVWIDLLSKKLSIQY